MPFNDKYLDEGIQVGDLGHVDDHNELHKFHNYAEQRVVDHFTDENDRDQNIPAPINGRLAFLDNRQVMTVFDGGAWRDMGEKGDVGPAGPGGPQGPIGQTGSQGPKGDQGTRGIQGPTGGTGPEGPQGIPGAVGPEGPEGPEGPQGDPGGPPGPEGPEGPVGPEGPKGDTGDKGDPGPSGPSGPEGPQGIRGDTGLKGDTGEQGPRGYPGATGQPGEPGPTGPKGEDSTVPGPEGPEGPQGPKGEDSTVPGPEGPEGPEGPQGPKGDPGEVEEAPEDGTPYSRQDTGWVAAPAGGDYLPLSGGTMEGNIDMGMRQILNVGGPFTDGEAANKQYVDNNAGISDAPSDGTLYGRKDADWVGVPAGGGGDFMSDGSVPMTDRLVYDDTAWGVTDGATGNRALSLSANSAEFRVGPVESTAFYVKAADQTQVLTVKNGLMELRTDGSVVFQVRETMSQLKYQLELTGGDETIDNPQLYIGTGQTGRIWHSPGEVHIGPSSSTTSMSFGTTVKVHVLLSMEGEGIVDLKDPSDPQDAATKAYVDSVAVKLVADAKALEGRVEALEGTISDLGNLVANLEHVIDTILNP